MAAKTLVQYIQRKSTCFPFAGATTNAADVWERKTEREREGEGEVKGEGEGERLSFIDNF